MRFYKFLVLITLVLSSFFPSFSSNRVEKDDGIIKILAIGNSFSQDAIETYLHELAQAEGIQVIIGNLYIGGASLELHWKNASNNTAAYDYRKISLDNIKTNQPNTSIADALLDENWDYISFQQASPFSGQYSTYEASLPSLFNYVKGKASNPKVKYILHQTWAYAQNSTHAGFSNYNRDQMTMYNAIQDATRRAKKLVDIDLLIPAGTAIQNGRSSTIGDHFTRDGYHLDLTIGRYTAACTWFEAIFGKSVIGNPYKPDGLSSYEAEIAQKAAHFAIKKPHEITVNLDALNGKEKFTLEMNGYVFSSAAIAGDRVVFGDFSGMLYVVNTQTGKIEKEFKTDGRLQYKNEVLDSKGKLDFVHTAGRRDYSLYETSKYVLDEYYKLGAIVSSPVVVGKTIYVGSANGNLYAVNWF